MAESPGMTFKNRVALVSAPWPFFSRPSIQLGTLKAYLKKQMPDLRVAASHFYLRVAEAIGYELYHSLSERTWSAETVYGALLFPDRFDKIEKLYLKQVRGKKSLEKIGFDKLVRKVETVSRQFVDDCDWSDFDLAGFTVCLCQLTSSLYLMKQIKAASPNVVTLAGGSLIATSSVRDMLNAFAQVDAAIVGEGEKPLAALVEKLAGHVPLEKIASVTGVVTRNSDETANTFSQLSDLDQLPQPDYQDYFDLLDTFAPEKKFFPSLHAEISRGCWHRLKPGPGESRGCAFCNLNLQWKGYRSKKTARVVTEIEELTSRHQTLSVAFVDNVLPPKRTSRIFKALPSLKKDLGLFCELRASVGENDLKLLRRAGVGEVQVGIEALSTSLLEKINKGTTAIENLEVMKHCESLSMAGSSNLILHFPGSDETDVEETLRNMPFAEVFRPLKIVGFWLGLESPVYLNHRRFGLKAVFNHPNYRSLFPSEIVDSVKFMIQDYRGDKARQKKLWRPVEKAAAEWKRNYAKLHEKAGAGHVLSYMDGRDFLIVRRRRVDKKTENHRLTGTSRAIYLFCGHTRPIREILENFKGLTEDRLLPFLNMMIRKKLMFGENGRYLSLAVPAASPCD